ncbi:MAG TPA: hypothetical protein VM513_10890 [Kofleriaceae bacterium]|nr:hypothetical protein [Kofleriaceae bacterium]
MRLRSVVVGATLVVVPEAALAERPDIEYGPPSVNDLVFARQVLDPPPAAFTAGAPRVAQSRVIYLNKNGVTLIPGNNDARIDRSSIAKQTTAIPAWTPSAQTWTETVTCMREMFARWDVTVTDEDPGDVPHIEAVFGGTPSLLGLAPTTAGIAPFTKDCGIIENAIVLTFTKILPEDAQMVCEIMAQEVAHAYGLDHEMLAPDPMSYIDYDGDRAFQDQDAACGEREARPCGIGGNVCRETQNSVALLGERLGRAGSSSSGGSQVPPGSSISSPLDDEGGCAAGGSAGLLVGLVGVFVRRLQRRRAHR